MIGRPRVGIVGDFDRRNATHRATDDALAHLGLAAEWVPTEEVGADAGRRLAAFAALWIAPASPYRSMEGALAAIRHARERGVPLVGT
jgi:CTP synthase (UTP-ammonia lyase)